LGNLTPLNHPDVSNGMVDVINQIEAMLRHNNGKIIKFYIIFHCINHYLVRDGVREHRKLGDPPLPNVYILFILIAIHHFVTV
jgi:hypothetical protein